MGKTRNHGNRGAVQKGSMNRPPSKRGPRNTGYQLSGGVPWPELGDGTPYTPAIQRVQHRDFPEWAGKIQWTEFRGPEGEHLKERTKPATKTMPERVVEGAEWYGVVSWDNPDDPDRPLTMIRLSQLEVENGP